MGEQVNDHVDGFVNAPDEGDDCANEGRKHDDEDEIFRVFEQRFHQDSLFTDEILSFGQNGDEIDFTADDGDVFGVLDHVVLVEDEGGALADA